jgi:hypothetical protein
VLEPGEVELLVFPLGRDWAIFGRSHAGLSAALSAPPGPELEARPTHPALAAAAPSLERAARVVLLPYGAAWQWPFERWQVAGKPLSARRLEFSVGLSRARGAQGASPRGAAVAADPRGDLPLSRREGLLVQQALRLPASRVLLGAQVTPTALLDLLETADFLHYAGHARGAPSGAAPALPLAAGTELQVWELAGLRAVPRQLVLSACESAANAAPDAGLGWGFAQALLALGAEAIIAPVGPIEDGAAYEFQRAFYAAIERGREFGEAFHEARRAELARGHPEVPLRLFRR